MPIFTLTLLEKKTIAQNTLELTFEKPANFNYIAGQYGGFTLINPSVTDEKGNTRRFSFASAPHEPHLSIATRIQTSAYKQNLQNMTIGSTIKLAGPTGNFILHQDANIPTIMLAGGIGIAPFYSMIKEALKQHPERAIHVYYGNQTRKDAAFLEALETLAAHHPHFKLTLVLSAPEAGWTGETGYIDAALIMKQSPNYEACLFYACGSPAMVNAMKAELAELAVKEEQIYVEDFPGY